MQALHLQLIVSNNVSRQTSIPHLLSWWCPLTLPGVSLADGREQLVLEINGPAFAPASIAFCSNCSEQREANAQALAWAWGLRNGVAAALLLSSSEF